MCYSSTFYAIVTTIAYFTLGRCIVTWLGQVVIEEMSTEGMSIACAQAALKKANASLIAWWVSLAVRYQLSRSSEWQTW